MTHFLQHNLCVGIEIAVH